MSADHREEGVASGGFVGHRHDRLWFTELGEAFIARMVLAKCPNPETTTSITVQLSIRDFFRRFTAEELVAQLDNEIIAEAPKMSEMLGDLFSGLVGHKVAAREHKQPALDYFHEHISTRLKWLKSGDPGDNVPPCIDGVTSRACDKLVVFDIVVRPSILRERLGAEIPALLERRGEIHQKITSLQCRPPETGPRIDYRKQVELLTNHLDHRQDTTGETTFSILSNNIPFRWAVACINDTDVTMPGVGTSTVEEKVLLLLLLEVNGFLDITDIDLESSPLAPHDVVVRYVVRRPSKNNIFRASNAGLVSTTRALMNETELTLYHRLHSDLREGLVFGGKPGLESSFGELGAWLIRKATYCLEEPGFMGQPARQWLLQHADDKTVQMEDQFFLPALYERLRNEFGARVVKKPERFGGEIDILFDDAIPIELKVRRNRVSPLDIADVDKSYPPSGQAAVYASVSRLGLVAVLDLPSDDTQMVNLENCATVVERRFPVTSEYPTCIVVIVFRCYARKPSGSR